MKRIAILGSTGSIGINTLDVISRLKGRFEVIGLSASANVGLLARQAISSSARVVSVMDSRLEKDLKILVPGGVEITSGEDGLLDMVSRPDVDLVVFAISGNVCLRPLMKAIEEKKEIALANKEALVSAGEIIMASSRKNNVRIIPIDSEHSAIFQCMEGRLRKSLKKIYLTSSGGPLLNVAKKEFKNLTKELVLNHPRWKMGRKITVDSATLMNKGLEVIEARHLFDIDESSIEVLTHPEAVVHSMVELLDGSIIAQLAAADMRLPIQFALTYPERVESDVKRLDLAKIKQLNFQKPDLERFPSLSLARQALKTGRTYPTVLNAADEEAVGLFLHDELPFFRIPSIVEDVLARHKGAGASPLTIDDVFEADSWARMETRKLCCH